MIIWSKKIKRTGQFDPNRGKFQDIWYAAPHKNCIPQVFSTEAEARDYAAAMAKRVVKEKPVIFLDTRGVNQ